MMTSDIPSNPTGEFERSGEYLGTQWSIEMEGNDAWIAIGDAQVRAAYDGYGYVSHEVVGRWHDPAQIADILVRYHPDYSPLARDPVDDVNA